MGIFMASLAKTPIIKHMMRNSHLHNFCSEMGLDFFLADLPDELVSLTYSSQFDPSLLFYRKEAFIRQSNPSNQNITRITDEQ